MDNLTGQQLERQADLADATADEQFADARQLEARAKESRIRASDLTKRAIAAYKAQALGLKD